MKQKSTKSEQQIIRVSFILLLASILTILFATNSYSKETWHLLYQPRQRIIKSIDSYKENLFIGTGNGVLVSKDKGITWNDFGTDQLQKDFNGNSLINWIFIDKGSNLIYIATSNGAYYSNLEKPEWHQFFKETKIESNNINSLYIEEDKSYLATNDGLWICNLNDNFCERLNTGLKANNISGNYEVFYITKHNDDLYTAISNGIYVLDKEKLSWQNQSDGIQSLPDGLINARHLLEDKNGNLWAASSTGIYLKNDELDLWEKVSSGINKNNNGFEEAFYLFEDLDTLYAACSSGVYLLNKETNTWEDITAGIRTKENNKTVYWLHRFENNILAATDEGVFVLKDIKKEELEEDSTKLVLKGKIETDFANLDELEPSVVEIQKQALRFAALPTSGDYKRYRLQARLRNLFPSVGFDINSTGTHSGYYERERGLSTDISLNNSFDAGRTTRFQNDGRSFKQLGIQWNTNELIYDDEIKDILSQARLTANIRENLLDDVTRIYYQRKKLLLETLITPPENIETKLTNQLAVNELTGQLDSRTGGWFSKEISRRKRNMKIGKQ